jgi:hypothetical protein
MSIKQTVALCTLAVLVAACGPSEADKRAAAAAALEAKANQDLAAYRQLLQAGSDEFAVTMGRQIVSRYPSTQAAAEVQRSLAEVEARAKASADSKRLAALWIYQTGTQSGALQHSAMIYDSSPGGDERPKLILRRHAEWGQSVYLFGSGKGFACGAPCRLSVRFDDAPAEPLAAFLPETGEPAIFIEDDQAFLARLPSVDKLTIEAPLKDGGSRTFVFEVGGYDPARFLELPAKS